MTGNLANRVSRIEIQREPPRSRMYVVARRWDDPDPKAAIATAFADAGRPMPEKSDLIVCVLKPELERPFLIVADRGQP